MTDISLRAGPTWGERSSLLGLSVASNILALALPLALLQVYDRIIPNQAQGTAVVLFSVVLIALLADGFLRYVRFRTLAHIAARYEFASTQRLIERVFSAKLSALMQVRSGRLRAAIAALSQARELYTGQGLLPFFDAPFGIIFLLFVWYIGGTLVLVPIAILVLLGLVALWSGRQHRRSLVALASAEQERSSLFSEAFAGLESYKMLGLAGPLFRRFYAVEADRATADQASERLGGLFTDLSQTGSQAATIAIALFGSLIVLQGEMTTGGLAACSILGGRGIGALLGLVGAISRREAARAADEQVASILALAPQAGMPAQPQASQEPVPTQAQTPQEQAPQGRRPPQASSAASLPLGVRFSDLTLMRPGATLTRVSGEIPPGVIVALELDRRSDAELLLQAVTGLEEADAGRIELTRPDGTPTDQPLSAQTAFVPARPAIFAGSILDNISLFDKRLRPQARELANEIGLTAIADRLPNGLRTEVGYETLTALPSGAIKRAAIARALILRPGLLAIQSPGRWLDVDGVARLRTMLEARRGAMTILLATGDQKLLDAADFLLTIDATTGRLQLDARRSQS